MADAGLCVLLVVRLRVAKRKMRVPSELARPRGGATPVAVSLESFEAVRTRGTARNNAEAITTDRTWTGESTPSPLALYHGTTSTR